MHGPISKTRKLLPHQEMENSLNSQLLPMPSSANLSPPWVGLPRDITAMILHKLGAIEIVAVAENVCTTWRSVCRDPSMWQSIDMGNTIDDDFHDSADLDRICRRAVDLSQGQLADITIDRFCDGDLLIYISERCPRLRRLQIACCDDLEDGSLSTALKNLPLLEELHLYRTPINPSDVEMVGISCPLLKSFKLNHPLSMDSVAEQIFQTMPELRHLELIGINISEKGLQAILDGCPHLETLDLRGCYKLDFSGDIEKACYQRIKVLRRPGEPLEEYPFFGQHHLPYYDACSACSGDDVDLMSDSGGNLDDVERSTRDNIVGLRNTVTTALGRPGLTWSVRLDEKWTT